MTTDRNAAIWFAADGYDPAKGVNGRRMAGESFLRGFFRHAQVDEFVSLAHGPSDARLFETMARDNGVTAPVRGVRLDQAAKIAPVGSVFYSGPNFAPECWRRAPFGATAWSICGITHTMSTKAVMEGVVNLRSAPQAEWDAVICTSRSVQTSMRFHLDLIDRHLADRFGAKLPPRPQTPVIPLGVDCDAFTVDPAAGAALRARLGIAPEDIAALVIARMTPHEKFDPLPMYLALRQAQQGMAPGTRLHLILYGRFPDDYSRKVFETGAAQLMPDVGFHTLPHDGDAARRAALSAAQMFLFPIDNLQESFGIAPVEAMAAGLPVVASDWDGLKDTVSDDVGFRIPTLGARPEHVTLTGLRYGGGTDSYIQYLSQVSAVTRIDVVAMGRAILTLAQDAGLRAKMGAAGRVRARALYDWGVVIPQMQDLFAELAQIRKSADPKAHPPVPAALVAMTPSPMALFANFPTDTLRRDDRAYVSVALEGRPGIAETLALRNYRATKREFESLPDILAVAAAIDGVGMAGATVAALAATTAQSRVRVERILLWLMKYDFVREADR